MLAWTLKVLLTVGPLHADEAKGSVLYNSRPVLGAVCCHSVPVQDMLIVKKMKAISGLLAHVAFAQKSLYYITVHRSTKIQLDILIPPLLTVRYSGTMQIYSKRNIPADSITYFTAKRCSYYVANIDGQYVQQGKKETNKQIYLLHLPKYSLLS